MDYSTMSLVELKKAAKGRRIKQYYIMKRIELIRILGLPELPQEMKIEKMTIHELRRQAKERRIRGFWQLNRSALVDLLFNTPANQNQEDKGNTDKHDAPQKQDTHDVRIENSQESG